MASEHIELMELLKAYLLEELPHENAEAVELRYFQDRTFLYRVQAAEGALIKDYLDGRLAGPRRARFEARYLTVPELRAQVESARLACAAVARPVRLGVRWQYLPAAAVVVLVVLGGGVLVSRRGQAPVPAVLKNAASPAVLVALSPGLVKGSQSTAEFTLPPAGGSVRFVLDLPGRNSTADYAVHAALVEADGQRRRVWETRQPVRSVASGTGQSLSVDADSAAFTTGDYVLEIAALDGRVQETYTFRAYRAR
jgi:hypothetical protein